MKKAIYITAAAFAAFIISPLFSTVAYAGGGDTPTEDEAVICEPAPTEAPPVPVTQEPNPFTPSGTGTVMDNATDEDGKEFYTITTPDEHIFYLIIDRQREAENVYFLNAVTIADLAALAEVSENPQTTPPPPATSEESPIEPTPVPEREPEPEPEQGGGNTVMYMIIAVLALIGGAAGWYFKVYRPKQQGVSNGDEYEPTADEADYSDDWDDEQDEADDGPPWDEDENDGQ
jgi:hypothetical protein